MRQTITVPPKGIVSILIFIFLQSLFGKWIFWSRLFPEGDLALVVLLSYAIGPMRGASLGGLAGLFRDSLSTHPFGLDLILLGGVGFLSGFLGQRRRFGLPWQKLLIIFGAVVLEDILFLLLTGSSSGSPPFDRFSYYQESLLPNALLTTLLGTILQRFFP